VGYQFDLSYSSSHLEVDQVKEGALFTTDYDTYFNAGTVTPGNIEDVYGAILGGGSVQTPGVLVTTTFKAKNQAGVSSLNLHNVIIADENAEAAPIEIINSSVTVEKDNNNEPPYPPSIPSGPTSLDKGKNGEYSTSASDHDYDKIKYYFDWGDETGNWTEFVNSGESAEINHVWKETGAYKVRVRAKDEHGTVSDWSDPLEIKINKSRSVSKLSFITYIIQFLEKYYDLQLFFQLIKLLHP
jgi:hypothetical protein